MNIPNVGPQLPIVNAPQAQVPAPMMPPSTTAPQLGCIGCTAELPQLSDVVKPAIPTWVIIAGVLVLVGGVFGLIAYANSRKHDRYPDEP